MIDFAWKFMTLTVTKLLNHLRNFLALTDMRGCITAVSGHCKVPLAVAQGSLLGSRILCDSIRKLAIHRPWCEIFIENHYAIAMDLGLLRLLRCCSLHFSLVASGVVGLQHGKQSEDIPTDLEWCRGRIMKCHGFCNCIPIRRHIWRETRKVTRCLKIPWNKDEWMAKKRIANKTNKDE